MKDAFTDWDCVHSSGAGSWSWATDHCVSPTHSGKFSALGVNTLYKITRHDYSKSQVQMIFWARYDGHDAGAYLDAWHPSFGLMAIKTGVQTVDWTKYRATFWYDGSKKYGTVEYWTGSSWEMIGSLYDFGTGAPGTDTAGWEVYSGASASFNVWFDDVSFYSR
jgi:hypothetical protein